MKTVAIIGSGIAGIALAARLQIKGYSVSVFEAHSEIGGKLAEKTIEGYRFDKGPSLFTMPHFVDEIFREAGKNPKDYFSYKILPTLTHYFWEDGTQIRAYSDKNKFFEEIEQKLGEDKKAIQKYLQNGKEKYYLVGELFLHKSLHKINTFFNKSAFRAYSKIWKLDAFRTMNQANEAAFQNPKLVQLFNRYATYNGSNPYEAPATLTMIPHLEFNIGAFFPEKGMRDIPLSIAKLAENLGAKFYVNTPVEQILIEDKKAVGVQIAGKKHFFDHIVSNVDVVNTYKKLLPTLAAPKKILEQPKSSSALIFYWGINTNFENLDVHNILFSDNYKAEFDEIFEKKSIFSDPTVYIHISSKVNKEDAPPNCENWFVMINTPNDIGQNWEELRKKARKDVISKINRVLKTDIQNHIVVEDFLDAPLIEQLTSSSQGALYGNSSNNKWAAFLRHANFSNIKNLYFCGGSVHPGGGIPLCLSSAKIVSEFF